jgi:hypothetical protein
MNCRRVAWIAIAFGAAGGCVCAPPREHAAMRMSWPVDTMSAVAAPHAVAALPSVDGDILKGTSPAELAVARSKASQALTQALTKP